MKAHILQHVPFEGAGSIEAWLRARDATISYTHFHEPSPVLPDVDALDVLIVMGGPMSVNDERLHPWLRMEKRFIREAILRGKPVLGICLGAQLMASTLGARVYANDDKEIGWFPVEAEPAEATAFVFPPVATVFHWHGETFDLPPGAVRLAASAACRNQAFQVGARAIGLQFHLETTPESAEALLYHCRAELVRGKFIQSERRIREQPEKTYHEINRLMDNVLGYLTRP